MKFLNLSQNKQAGLSKNPTETLNKTVSENLKGNTVGNKFQNSAANKFDKGAHEVTKTFIGIDGNDSIFIDKSNSLPIPMPVKDSIAPDGKIWTVPNIDF